MYRARDPTLRRDVALKVLPAGFARDSDRLARFRREAHVLATLNHPHIAAIYGFEDADGVHALVLELVERPTLADRIARGPIPVADALTIATQFGEGVLACPRCGGRLRLVALIEAACHPAHPGPSGAADRGARRAPRPSTTERLGSRLRKGRDRREHRAKP